MIVTKYRSAKLVYGTLFEPCPLCGQSNRYDIVDHEYGVKGIRTTYFRRSIFTGKLYRIIKERFECRACGAEWEHETSKERIIEGWENDSSGI